MISVPVSIGELVDKITILKIKMDHFSDATKLQNVRKEHDALVAVCGQHKIDLSNDLVSELEAVNRKLWKIEDDIRDEEKAKKFGDNFVALARAVYVVNDERFGVKNKINKHFGSDFQEEKGYKEYL